jgi:acetyl/propionyl-CoA carboxylase alpha subunit
MARALREYEVLGIRTTVPFFRWLLAQPAFVDGEFHTGYLDEVLQQRRGEPFVVPDEDVDEVAAIAAALHDISREHTRPSPDSAWKQSGRSKGLRR